MIGRTKGRWTAPASKHGAASVRSGSAGVNGQGARGRRSFGSEEQLQQPRNVAKSRQRPCSNKSRRSPTAPTERFLGTTFAPRARDHSFRSRLSPEQPSAQAAVPKSAKALHAEREYA